MIKLFKTNMELRQELATARSFLEGYRQENARQKESLIAVVKIAAGEPDKKNPKVQANFFKFLLRQCGLRATEGLQPGTLSEIAKKVKEQQDERNT